MLGKPYSTLSPGTDSTCNRRHLVEAEHLYHAGDNFQGFFQVVSGSFKTLSSTISGVEQVLEFYIAGDFLGMDAIFLGEYPSSTIALEKSEVCSISYAALDPACAVHAGVQNKVLIAMSREIRRKREIITLLGHMSATERVAVFLIDLLDRTATAGHEIDVLRLPMKHCDIASFLGMSNETVSRQFTKLKKLGLIRVKGSAVQIANRSALECVIGVIDKRRLFVD